MAAVLLGLSVLACSGFTSKVSRRFGGELDVTVRLDSQLNQDFPLAVDTVVVYDKDLFAELSKLTAEAWFAQRDQYRIDNEPKKLEVTAREWVPLCTGCSQPEPLRIEHRIGAHGAVVFANYFNPGTHRIVVEPLKSFTLKLSETEASPEPAVKPSRKERRQAKKAAKQEKKRKKKEKAAGGEGP